MVSEKTIIAANRFGLGARPGELERIGDRPQAWLLSQLTRASRDTDSGLPGSVDVLTELQAIHRSRDAARRNDDAERLEELNKTLREFFRSRYVEQATHRYRLAATTESPFRERLVHFWTNHFAVSADKRPLPALAGTLEAEAIRPHVTGRFLDMLTAVEKHPAMILYLDNQSSMGPGSSLARAAARRGRALGLNENLAREILELHTLGVDGGYEQSDVTTFAKVLTGWSVGGGRGPLASGPTGEFFFRSNMHEPGAQTLLGRTYPDDGVRQAEAVLRDLASSPATARFLAEKIARHFVADSPPEALVDRLVEAYLDSSGELMPVYETLINSLESWEAPFAKYKTPQDFLISAYRAFGREPDNPQRMIAFLELLGQRPYTPGSPAGWPDTAPHWDGGEALMRRIEWAGAVGGAIGDRVSPTDLAGAILGPLVSERTLNGIASAESAAQGLTLLLASPEFQRR